MWTYSLTNHLMDLETIIALFFMIDITNLDGYELL